MKKFKKFLNERGTGMFLVAIFSVIIFVFACCGIVNFASEFRSAMNADYELVEECYNLETLDALGYATNCEFKTVASALNLYIFSNDFSIFFMLLTIIVCVINISGYMFKNKSILFMSIPLSIVILLLSTGFNKIIIVLLLVLLNIVGIIDFLIKKKN